MGLYYRFCHPSGPLYLCGERGDATMPSPIHKRHSKVRLKINVSSIDHNSVLNARILWKYEMKKVSI